ncbi:type VI secretion system lipoprotein TssJ [Kosakonia radicincitans]|uniref:Type VI secretion lipoprotein, VC_A0113 family n=1 Tax=Kosakonia radicincitans TaxID=283686 RepID=A0AAX2ER75_9ENTR|nr:type VI secretion system lipoprotein TssJ [Kosakonia radicincitans]MDP9567459.1 type VI secretion system VasD/TssJ family lipoprotein [Kosakonia oryzae]MDD7995528.1 type VI secretion system lipoprotein TssJ [Kosakonia radicincitans]QEM91276.1 type VI secretion system lipoprotein TssJ [Kosakonia radicincitans]SFE89256.1 type VI secretion lipoprotein, VC_A0113 family [Kosakonia radicincitans]SFR10714.1 type VI secretion lipoprotein, VC_A0113 family [Kosakonia radicincitans]
MPGKHTFIIAFCAALLSGCAEENTAPATKQQAIDQVAAPFAQGAITLAIQTDPDLNAVHGIANSCTLLVIQAQQANTLSKLLSNPFALKNLFSAAGAQDEILKVDRYAAMPGQHTTLHIDRSENTRYLAVVAGYYPFPQKQHMALIRIPVTTESSGWWTPRWQAQLAPLTLTLHLGSNSMTQFTGAEREPLRLQNAAPAPAPSPASQGG